ncbi:hypothetical protein CWT02_1640 [Salmonella enterica subsp. enterica serovar Cubana]|nr:hypothetical protein CWT02_1640 [Salmonella enterica subsp. enterica serovar Cubana]
MSYISVKLSMSDCLRTPERQPDVSVKQKLWSLTLMEY